MSRPTRIALPRRVDSKIDIDRAVWSPDGLRIAFSAYHSGNGYYRSSVWVMDANGHNVKRIARGTVTDNDFLPESISWQPTFP